jgi:DNA-binding MarR family transcriptional regulator
MQDKRSNQQILFLTDEQLRLGIEAMFFAYRGFTADSDKILKNYSYGRAHHRALHFINSYPGTTVNNLLQILEVTKQSLNRVLRSLIIDGLVEVNVGKNDKRQRNLTLTVDGKNLENELSIAQRGRMRLAYKAAGPEAVAGFRTVLDYIVDPIENENKNHSEPDSELLE